jgi:glycosyltransferase involved in cell wall biosynthesis
MHLDALVATATAIAGLRKQGVAAQLVLHTHPSFWTAYESTWRNLGVENGGLITHSLLEQRLRDADLLLVVASFLLEHAPMSRSSVQTKLTDYMAAGTPILGVGPLGAASLDFIEQWGLGVTCTSAEAGHIAATLRNWMEHPADLDALAKRAHEVLETQFDPEIVCPRLWQFIASVAVRRAPSGLGEGPATIAPNAIA